MVNNNIVSIVADTPKRRVLLNEQLVQEFTRAGCSLNVEDYEGHPSIMVNPHTWNFMVKQLHEKHNHDRESHCYGVGLCLCPICLGLPYMDDDGSTYYGFKHSKEQK